MWPLYPIALKKFVIATTSATRWSEYQRLTKLLSIGMPPTEVEQVLGSPKDRDKFSVGERWFYGEDESTVSWTYVAEFERAEGAESGLKLCYVKI